MSRYRRVYGTIEARGRSVRVRCPGGAWYTLPLGSTIEDADCWLAEQRLLERTGCRYEPSSMTFADLARVWLEDEAKAGIVSASTLRKYGNDMARLEPLVGRVKLPQLNRQHVEMAKTALSGRRTQEGTAWRSDVDYSDTTTSLRTSSGKKAAPLAGSEAFRYTSRPIASAVVRTALSPKTINQTLDTGRAAWAWAEDHNLVRPPNPWSQVDRLRVPRYEARHLSVAEARRFYAAALADNTVESRLLLAGLLTGKRTKSEWRPMHWRDVDLERGVAVVRWIMDDRDAIRPAGGNKTRQHAIPLPPQLVAVLEAQRDHQRDWQPPEGIDDPEALMRNVQEEADRLVFTREQDGQSYVSRIAIDRARDRIMAAAGIPGHLRIHDLRHTTASLLLGLGATMKEVQTMLAHTKLATTADIYAHLQPEVLQGLAGQLGQALSE